MMPATPGNGHAWLKLSLCNKRPLPLSTTNQTARSPITRDASQQNIIFVKHPVQMSHTCLVRLELKQPAASIEKQSAV
jgi:hypothetical protein